MRVFTEEEVSKMKPVKNVKVVRKLVKYPMQKLWSSKDIMENKEVDLDGIR